MLIYFQAFFNSIDSKFQSFNMPSTFNHITTLQNRCQKLVTTFFHCCSAGPSDNVCRLFLQLYKGPRFNSTKTNFIVICSTTKKNKTSFDYKLKQFIKEFKTKKYPNIEKYALGKVHPVFTNKPKNGGNLLIMPKEKPDTRTKRRVPNDKYLLKMFCFGDVTATFTF